MIGLDFFVCLCNDVCDVCPGTGAKSPGRSTSQRRGAEITSPRPPVNRRFSETVDAENGRNQQFATWNMGYENKCVSEHGYFPYVKRPNGIRTSVGTYQN